MHLYMSGTPRNDPYQTVENRMCTHRLFSLHGDYEKAVQRWVKDLRAGILDADAYLKAYPQHVGNIKERDARRRAQQRDYARTEDWDTAHVLEEVCERFKGRPYPRAILLDSGAFTAWNKGEHVTVDEVRRKYEKFIEAAGNLFEEIWMINLDVIPGERGRDPTPQELIDAVKVSDVNFEILRKEFGDRILPVFHQGESDERLAECVEQVRGKSNYLCVSPRNDLPEGKRVVWSRDCHTLINANWPGIMTHGLATTGNKMVRDVPWYSGDSAAWVQHGGFGMIDIFHHGEGNVGSKNVPHYMNYFVSLENVKFDFDAGISLPDGSVRMVEEILDVEDSSKLSMREISEGLVARGIDPDDFPLTGGHFHDAKKHFYTLLPPEREYVRSRVERLGFPFEIVRWDSRVRNLVCMAEFVEFAEWANSFEKAPGQLVLEGL